MDLNKAALDLANEMSRHIIGKKMIAEGDACLECVNIVKRAMEQAVKSERKECQQIAFHKGSSKIGNAIWDRK